MVTFVLRRLVATILVLAAASFIVFTLTAISGDPLQELRGSSAPNRQERIDQLTEELHLNQTPVVRYFYWLPGAAKCLIGQCDLGNSYARGGLPVTQVVGAAASSTIQLITGATLIALVLGVAVGMISAIRQYSGFDYVVTFFSFVLYSLPIFFVAVLLKEYGAIQFNAFLDSPEVPIVTALGLAIVTAIIWSSIVGGSWRRRLIVGGATGIGAGAVLYALGISGWFLHPILEIPGIAILGVGVAVGVTALSNGFAHKRALFASLTVVALWVALYTPLQNLFFYVPQLWTLAALFIVSIGVGLASGFVWGKDDKRQLGRSAAITSFVTVALVIIDRTLRVYPDYKAQIHGSVIGTIGSSSPGLQGDMWFTMLDSATHIALPTIALAVVSFAAYTRYARSSLLEVMNQDYVRTARAKGLTERTVIMRHAFRNALIPIATIVAFDIGGLIGGAIITERIFAWKGMGALFSEGLNKVDVNLVMGFFLLTGTVAVLFNFIADLVYAGLDPRIRVS
jgi:peptide/nickel transport system permease protein